jgi:hypothetical protein
MLVTLILQTFIKDEYIENIYTSLENQIKEIKSENISFNILIIQDNIKGYKKEKDPTVIYQFDKVKEINNRLSKNDNTTYLLVENNMHPSPLCAYSINYSFEHFKCDYFIIMEDDLVLSDNFLSYYIYGLQNLLTPTNIVIAAESLYFDARRNTASNEFIDNAKKLIDDLNLEIYYTTFNFLPSSCFGSNLNGWELIKTTRGNKNPTGATLCNPLFKEKNYNTIMPIVPRCKDVGMIHDLGFSVLWHGKSGVREIKNTYLLSKYNKNIYKEFHLDKNEIYYKTVTTAF